ncbi:MAG TPA: glycosyltransferase family 2 protein [Thermoleophilaceae bacterium]|nr:glycosyltransferase family 2 protein [Thermoleophilaceae bacterium]
MADFVTIVVPTLNEELHIEQCLRGLLDDPYPRDHLEVLVVDGGSTDATVAIAERFAAELPLVRVVHNPGRFQSAAFNLALRVADDRATCLLRCDAHALYPPGFVSRAVETLERTGAAMVGFPVVATAESPFQAAVAFAQTTRVGIGGSAYRVGGKSGWVESAMHGCFSRKAVEAVGGYDETVAYNEDAELSLRLQAVGGVWLDEELRVGLLSRPSLGGLTRQYFFYGRGRAATVVTHRQRPHPRQLAPPALVIWHTILLLLGIRRRALLVPIGAYLAALTGVSAFGAARRREPALLASPVALATMHHAWGGGFIVGLCESLSRTGGL